MALPVLPSNGFITRLLQQTTQASSTQNLQRNTPTPTADKPDSMSISNEARQAMKGEGSSQLESKLIELYNQQGKSNS